MSRENVRRNAFAGVMLSAAAVAAVQGAITPAAHAAPAPAPSPHHATHPRTSAVTRIEDRTARAVAASLADPAWRSEVRTAALASRQVDLRALAAHAPAGAGAHLKSAVTKADRAVTAAKGLGRNTGSLLRVRLGADSMRKDLTAGAVPLVAVAPADDHARTATAYDSRGRAHLLDLTRVPESPVYLVDIDVDKALTAGLDVLRQEFAERGLSAPRPAPARTAAAGMWTTRINAVELSDDEEPWFKGDAEIYSLVSGFGWDGKVRVDPVDMPYLDNDGHVYYPNQILVNWSNYKYNLADAVMMEEDGSTNYRDLAKAIATALLTIADQGAYIPLVNAVLDAIPNDWWTDDPDYVDSWYTLARNDSGRRNGARGNGWMTVEPYYVQGF
ncbi:DUF3103 family protein [Wenjunlia tyrosinilytica]|uniref:DUF3103 family protein n=1 Tax=Wenjunlia tyrosinilytica TaxID=1544741 RepID=A0A917ZWW7_9ACTN|nr:DUF3103 family protein [Wenjunlia tyrosinilytica]GGO98506.1 hypothetical protein GCM10012280_62810 [Wenjunlia tyrosinilytica]